MTIHSIEKGIIKQYDITHCPVNDLILLIISHETIRLPHSASVARQHNRHEEAFLGQKEWHNVLLLLVYMLHITAVFNYYDVLSVTCTRDKSV